MGIESLKILIVDENKSYQESVLDYLNPKFSHIDVIDEWKTGLDYLKDNSPDIMIADLNSNDIDVLNLLKRIKNTDPNMQIIATSAMFEVDSLLEAIHVGITDFIPKPIDYKLLDEAIDKAIANIDNITPQSKEIKTIGEDIYNVLRYVLEQSNQFEFTNYYKGVPISRNGKVLSVNEKNVIEIKLDNVQFQALLFEKYIVFESKDSKKIFIAKLFSANQKDRTAKLKDLKYMQYSPKRRVDVRVDPDDNFKLVVIKDNVPYRVNVENISVKSISFDFTTTKERFNIDDKLVLNIAIYRKDAIQQKYKSVLKFETSIYKVVPKMNGVNIVVLFNLPHEDRDSLSKYIYQREVDIVAEFRELLRKSVANSK